MNELVKHLGIEDQEKIKELDLLQDLSLSPKAKVSNGLSDDQNNGMAAILQWLYTFKGSRNENNFFALRGSAGTGKTTLLGQLLKEIDNTKYRSSRICICAPTHKAKKVISVKTGWKNSETLQALLGLKLDVNLDDFDVNNPVFSPQGDRKIKDYDLVLIDESSMINTELYKTIVDCSKQSGAMILFIGDVLQLNPVKEYNISLSLTTPIHSYTLTQIMRQGAGNPLIELLDIVREDIINNTQTYLSVLQGMPNNMNSKGQGYMSTKDSSKFAEILNSTFNSAEAIEDKNYCRYISWTNDSINRTNKYIRNTIFNYQTTLEVGEILLSYKTVIQDEDILVVNSDDYVIEKVEEIVISDYTYPLQVLLVDLKGIDTGKTTSVCILKRDEQNYKNYQSVYCEELETAKAKRGRAWIKFYKFKSECLVLENMEYINPYTRVKELIKKDIDFGYGITAHKSQGSTYNTVFVNYKDISNIVTFEKNDKVGAEIMKKRLLYVALSRASEKAYIIL